MLRNSNESETSLTAAKRAFSQNSVVVLGLLLLVFFGLTNSGFHAQPIQQTAQDSLRQAIQRADSLESQVEGLAAEIKETKEEKRWVAITIFVLLGIIGLFIGFMIYLQNKFLKSFQQEQLATVFQFPVGLPSGTVRSMVTLIIVTFSLYLIILSAFKVTDSEFPEVLSAILSTILGFYFGSRTATQKESGLVEETQKQLNKAVDEREASKAEQLIKKVGKNIKLVKTVVDILPGDLSKKYRPLLEKLEKGAKLAEGLMGNKVFSKAAEEAGKAFEAFKKENPLRDIVSKAKSSFGKIVSNIPPLAIIGSVVGIGATIFGVAYHKWKARILNMPFDPAVVPLKVVDADTGFVLVRKSPILKQAFAEKMEAFDRNFMEQVANDFVSKEKDIEQLWQDYQQFFESREALESGLQEYRMAAAYLELQSDEAVATHLPSGTDYKTFVEAIDRIRADEEAGADLDLLVEVVEGLKKSDEPIISIFEKIKKEEEES
ncbi:hypothetical protein GWO43_22455 [candidate division KSB1 bacterium]|nr:hypothetical protein [candidate division KSB1 bacterium]NIR72708.1 hypothetical protein [candidate division KSB1 bacterium]NIS26793.1 hypothetical protein [candidate division KSB1 bacterium]NIT73587.1 hypothetical protein [candidate division KSB1 bacterium]NIU27463.1 hypothetical protein [candidate division KSB1 bacterium]